MIDSIYIALSGLQGHQRGLNVISNNVANLNTTGFKGSSVEFIDVFNADAGGEGQGSAGGGLDAAQTTLDLRAGEARQTGRDLDLMLEGNGFFVLDDGTGAQRYTRSGSFEFNADGQLVTRGSGLKVMSRDVDGKLSTVGLAGQRVSPPKATTQVEFTGNLSSTATAHAIDNVVVYDKLGGAHTLRFEFKPSDAATPGAWAVAIFEGSKSLGTTTLGFDGGLVGSESASKVVNLALNSAEAADVTLTFGDAVSGYSSGATSTLAVQQQDGYAAGVVTGLHFDETGVLQIAYSNGQSAHGATLALADLPDTGAMRAEGEGLFSYDAAAPAKLRAAGADLRVTGQSLELSNVDLTQEFSALILMQRGYQASSQVISTANEMLQELFDMKGGR